MRRKGHTWEREVAKRFRDALSDPQISRGLGQARARGDVPDVVVPGLWIEAKVGARTNPRAALEQAERDEKLYRVKHPDAPRRVPITVCKDDGRPPFVQLLLDDLLAMIRRAP